MQHAFMWIRSVAFYILYILCVIIFGMTAIIVGPFISYLGRHKILTNGGMAINRCLSLTCGINVQVDGRENIPDDACIVLSKHQSTWEVYFLQHAFRPVATILKKELMNIPIFGWSIRLMEPIAIDRSNRREAMAQVIAGGKKRLEAGDRVVIYPEGTRTPFGQVGRYGRSGAALAIESGKPIIPVSHNAGYCWPAKKLLKRSGKIHVIIGEPISPEGYTDSQELINVVKERIEEQQKKLTNH